MQNEIKEMQLWCTDSYMSLNRDKVQVVHFGQSNVQQEYSLDDQEEEDLGVLISDDLKPSKIVTRLSGRREEAKVLGPEPATWRWWRPSPPKTA